LAQLRRNGTGIHYETHGSGAPILLTHGVGATSRMWDEQVEEFTNRFRLILWDLPGHGQSEPPRRAVTAKSLTRDVLAILNAAEASRVVLVGLGAGGLIALRCWREMPDRVRGLVLIGTMPGLRNRPARQIWNGQVEELATTVERDGLDVLEGGAEVDPRLHTCAQGLAASARGILMQNDDGALPWLDTIDVPTLIIVGSEDKPNLSAAHYMARTIPNAREIVVPRANHAANISKAAAVNAAISDFLGRLPP
jgi:pimeloyl-ACP methyl ester carboxylesterase